MEKNQTGTAEWKESEDAIQEYFGEVLELSSRQILASCKFNSAKKRNWTITNLLEVERKEFTFEEEDKHYWLEWESFLNHLEKKFSIHFPRKGEIEDRFESHKDSEPTKISFKGINNEVSSEKLSELVSALIDSEDSIDRFCIFSHEAVSNEEVLLSMPFSESTKQLTYNTLLQMPIESFIQGYCSLKSEIGKFGRILVMDAVNYKAIIREMDSDTILQEYKNFRALVDDGWVVD